MLQLCTLLPCDFKCLYNFRQPPGRACSQQFCISSLLRYFFLPFMNLRPAFSPPPASFFFHRGLPLIARYGLRVVIVPLVMEFERTARWNTLFSILPCLRPGFWKGKQLSPNSVQCFHLFLLVMNVSLLGRRQFQHHSS